MSQKKRTHDGIEITVDNVRDDEVDIILESKAKRSIVLRRKSSAPQTRSYRRTQLVRQAVGNRHIQGKPKQKPKSAEHVEDTQSGNESHEEFIIVDEAGSESDGSSDIDCLVISDSICKYLSLIEHTKVDLVRGLTLEGALKKVETETYKLELAKYRLIVIHVGTNNIYDLTIDEYLELYDKIIEKVFQANPSARIALSAVLPRPIDTRCKPISDKRLIINFSLKLRARGDPNLFFLETDKKIMNKTTLAPINVFFCMAKGDKIHLNRKGNSVLQSYMAVILIS